MTDKRCSDGAMRAAEQLCKIWGVTDETVADEVAAIISEETGDLALIEALERSVQYLWLAIHDARQDNKPDLVKTGERDLAMVEAALATARKEG